MQRNNGAGSTSLCAVAAVAQWQYPPRPQSHPPGWAWGSGAACVSSLSCFWGVFLSLQLVF